MSQDFLKPDHKIPTPGCGCADCEAAIYAIRSFQERFGAGARIAARQPGAGQAAPNTPAALQDRLDAISVYDVPPELKPLHKLAADAIAALRRATEWQPLEAAPRDKRVLVRCPVPNSPDVWVGILMNHKGTWIHPDGIKAAVQPKGWMPLPSGAPEARAEATPASRTPVDHSPTQDATEGRSETSFGAAK